MSIFFPGHHHRFDLETPGGQDPGDGAVAPLILVFDSFEPLDLLGSTAGDDVVHEVVMLDSLRGHNVDLLEE